MMDHREIIETAAKTAGEILLKNFRGEMTRSIKEDRTLLTDIDKKSEAAIMDVLRANSSYGILSEEDGASGNESEFQWVIDPIDGTSNFAAGVPFFVVAIALLKGGEPILSVILDPVADELYFAEKGEGAFLNGKRIRVNTETIKPYLLYDVIDQGFQAPKFFAKETEVHEAKWSNRNLGSSELALAYLAAGRVDAVLQRGQKVWDFAAGVLLVREAGGTVSTWEGKPWTADDDNLIASIEPLHEGLTCILKEFL